MSGNKKYTVFISSTYEDLKQERASVIETILQLSQIPIGMENFTASSTDKWELIKKVIDDSDYMVVILGMKYGSPSDDRKTSWTEREYDYATGQDIPVLVFVIRDDVPLTNEKREKDGSSAAKSLKAFKEKTGSKNTPHWRNKDELARQVSTSLSNIMRDTPRSGWVRANSFQVSGKIMKGIYPAPSASGFLELLSEFESLQRLPLVKEHPGRDEVYTDAQITANKKRCDAIKYKARAFFQKEFGIDNPIYIAFEDAAKHTSKRKFINSGVKVLREFKNYFEQDEQLSRKFLKAVSPDIRKTEKNTSASGGYKKPKQLKSYPSIRLDMVQPPPSATKEEMAGVFIPVKKGDPCPRPMVDDVAMGKKDLSDNLASPKIRPLPENELNQAITVFAENLDSDTNEISVLVMNKSVWIITDGEFELVGKTKDYVWGTSRSVQTELLWQNRYQFKGRRITFGNHLYLSIRDADLADNSGYRKWLGASVDRREIEARLIRADGFRCNDVGAPRI